MTSRISDHKSPAKPTAIQRDATYWTIAYRNRRANHFKRATDLATNWHDASDAAAAVLAANPELDVYVTVTAEAERVGWTTSADDDGNIMMGNGKRIAIRETGSVAAMIGAAWIAQDEHDTNSWKRFYPEQAAALAAEQAAIDAAIQADLAALAFDPASADAVIFDHDAGRWVPFDPAKHGTHYDSDDWTDPK